MDSVDVNIFVGSEYGIPLLCVCEGNADVLKHIHIIKGIDINKWALQSSKLSFIYENFSSFGNFGRIFRCSCP